jgi:hypothetical protein
MITPELFARIRRLFFAEHWKVGTIATELGVHPDAVRRAIEVERFVRTGAADQAHDLDPYKALILETLEQHPRLRATRLHEMVRDRGVPRVGAPGPTLCAHRPTGGAHRGVPAYPVHEARLEPGSA